jgi:hypothetical protein
MKEIRALEGLEEGLGVRKAETAPSRASGRRAANLVFGPRHRKRVRWLAKDPRPQARERAEAGYRAAAERHEA